MQLTFGDFEKRYITYDEVKALFTKDAPENVIQEAYKHAAASPLKINSQVGYFFKKANSYPARIYVYIDFQDWQPRNRKPHGLQNSFPFLTRHMDIKEVIEYHLNWRLTYYQYESWQDLMQSEINVNNDLEFIERLNSFQSTYAPKLLGKPKLLKS